MTPDSLFQIASGFMAAKHLFVANEVGLFEQLADGAATLDELADRTGIARRRLRILADAMVALGLLERQDDRYQNGAVTAAFLSGHPRRPAPLPALLGPPQLPHLDEVRSRGAHRGGAEYAAPA